jgi:L-iditol 2-dehydrogenase
MKTTGLFGRKFIHLEERETELGSPGFSEVIVKLNACGVCGTDLNFLKQWEDEPMPLGHEIAGEVVETGPETPGIRVGDRVVLEDCSQCGICADCKNGRTDLCRNMHTLNDQSGMGRYMRVRHNNLVPFEGIPDQEACLTEPLSVCLNSVLAARIPFNGTVAVLGCGPLGLMTARIARLHGASRVFVTEADTRSVTGRARFDMARQWDFDEVIDTRSEDVEAVVKRHCPGGVDRVIVSSPPESIHDALKIIGYGGLITFFGLHFGGRNRIEVDINDLVFRKITLQPYFAEPAVNFRVSLDLIRSGKVPVRDLISHTFTRSGAKAMFTDIIEGTQPVIKAVMLPQEDN